MNLYDAIIAGKIAGGEGGSGVTVEPLTITENGTYSEEGKAYLPVTVNVKSEIEHDGSISIWTDNTMEG